MRVFPCFLAAMFLAAAACWSAPVFEGIPTAQTANVTPVIPVAKVLLVPVSVYDDAAPTVQQTIIAASSNPYISVRVKTGNPLLTMHFTHVGPTIDSDAVFQLFSDLTPKTTAYLSGFAEKGYYNGQILHRIANLNGSTTSPEFIYQGGDPLGSNPATAGTGGPGFDYENEPSVEGIFTGRGQLALANSYPPRTSAQGTNGSQFFITDSPVRELDFDHTIVGQMTHGFGILPLLRATPRSTGSDSAGNDITDRPVSDVKLTTASVSTRYTGLAPDGQATHTYTDAVLVLSAVRPGTSTITLRAGATTASFTVTATVDTFNDPPFIVPLDDFMTKAEQITLPARVVDLEYDNVDLVTALANNTSSSGTEAKATVVDPYADQPTLSGTLKYQDSTSSNLGPYSGPLQPILQATEWRPGYRLGYDFPRDSKTTLDYQETASVAIGTPPVTAVPVVLTGAPGVALTNAVVARFQDSDRLARPTNYEAIINWGDGANVSALGTIAFSTAPGGYHELTVSGTNTYAKAGIYPLVVTLYGASGWQKELRGMAVITANKIVATPESLEVSGASLVNRAVATFTDSDQPGPWTAYQATVDWGDGVVAPGTVRVTSPGHYIVFGTHAYADPEAYGFSVRIHKQNAAVSTDAVVWSRLRVSGFVARAHLPPYPQAHVSGLLTPLLLGYSSANQPVYQSTVKEITGNFLTQSQTYLSVQLEVKNSGNLAARASTLRVYLAHGTALHKTPVLDAQGHVVTPADTLLSFGPGLTSVAVQALAPGKGFTYYFRKSTLGDYRLKLPANEVGTGYNLIADLDPGDALVPFEPVPLPTYGRIEGVIVNPSLSAVQTSELGGSGTFSVSLDRKPTADVTIAFTGDSTEGVLDKSSLTFTSANWFSPQSVKVTGIPDSALPGAGGSPDYATTAYRITMLAQSADPLYDGFRPQPVTVVNADRDSTITVGAVAGTTTTAPAASTTATIATVPGGTGTIALTATKKPVTGSTLSVQIVLSDSKNGQIVEKGTTTPASTTVTFADADFGTGNTATKFIYLLALTDSTNAGKAVNYTVAFKATSTDPAYNGITPAPVTVTNTNP